MRRILFDATFIGLSVSLLWIFGNIWIYGGYVLGEPNLMIRAGETGLFVILIVIGVMQYVKDVEAAK